MTNCDIFTFIKEHGYFEYGAVIKGETLREFFDIKEIEYPAMKKDIDNQVLQELSCVEYIRNRLINDGKFFKGTNGNYRVLLPSENASQVISYMNSANNKLKRGIKLNKNTPVQHKINSNDEVRAMMKIDNIREYK